MLAKNGTPRKRQQAGGRSPLFAEPGAPTDGVLDSPEVPISNNLAENAIRPFVVGRKNWLFCDSVKGAQSSAIVYSIVETAKANGLEPYDYLLMILSLLPSKGKSPSHETLERLMPWHPDVQGREILRKKKH